MEKKAPPPPPRAFVGPPVANGAQSQPFARRKGPPNSFVAPPMTANHEQNAPPPPPQQPRAPQSFGFPAARAPVNTNAGAATRGWRPGRVGGRHDSPLYSKHRKRPSSSSMDSNVSWSGSEIESVGGFGAAHSEQEQQASRLSWASSVPARDEALPASQQGLAPAASLFGVSTVEQQPRAAVDEGEAHEMKQTVGSEGGVGVQPPKTPLGKPTPDNDVEISAAQRVRIELSAHAGSRAGSRANSSENMFATTTPPVYDEEKNGPQSCPSTFNNARQPQFSIDKLRQLRSNELVASKLLPTRSSVNSLMGYVRELQLSEATLRKQLVKTKQHTEEELSHSLSKVNELERTMQEVERDRELARRKLEEQEQLIRDLAAKLKQAEAAKSKSSAIPTVDELPPIAEEVSPQKENEAKTVKAEKKEPDTPVISPPALAPPIQPPMQQEQTPMPPVHPDQPKDNNRAAQFGLASPRSPNRPLWDPWASGGATPMKNLPPVFTIGSTGLDPVVASSTSAAQTSMTDSTTTTVGEYELKSVLMSPRQVQGQVEASKIGNPAQQVEQNEAAVPPGAQQEITPQYPAAVFNVGAMPSPLYPHQQDFASSESQNDAYGVQSQEEVPLMESPSQAVPMLPVAAIPPADVNSLEQQDGSSVPTGGNVITANGTGWNGFQAQQEGQPPATSSPSPMGAKVDNNEGMAPPPPPSFAEYPTVFPLAQTPVENAQSQLDASVIATPFSEDSQVTQPEQGSNAEAENVDTNIPSVPLLDNSPPQPPPTSTSQAPRPASPVQKENKTAPAEPVSLEALLVDFFTEVDKKRLKMAKVYGKRYAGRETWLFAELTKRYGAAKVATLKARYENGCGGDDSTAASGGGAGAGGANDYHTTNRSDASNQPKAGRQGHPRHPHFFHPPTPASNVDLSADMPPVSPPVAPPQEKDASSSQTRQVAEEIGTPPSPSGKVPPGRAVPVSPHQRRSEGNIPPFSGPPTSFPNPQETGEDDNAAAVGTDDPPIMSRPPPPIQPEKPTGQYNQPPSPPQNWMENSNAAPLGLRQRHNSSGLIAHGQKNSGAERPAVTLEGLLKELYRNHQPDKLKNASIVAKQYAGKERELVGLLKGKYGALSVKQLEENLDVLERAHRARMGGKGTGKKRGCFVRTILLVFWPSLLLYFSFGAVFVSFVVLDAWECHAFDSDERELESAEECLPLKKELETFTYERIADYVSQSHPDACFCLEWKARESALFTNFLGEDLVNLVRLVPFSPESFGTPWIVTVKEQVPSQEFYDSYAKPVVDLSLDVGSFVWSSVLDLAGYDEASEEKSQVVENAVEDNDTGDIPLLDEESGSDAHMGSQTQTAEVDNESFADKVEIDEPLTEEDEVAEAEAVAAGLDASVQVLVEEENGTFDEKVKTDEPAVAAAAKDDVLVEGKDVVHVGEEMPEKSSSFASEAEGEEHATVESINVLESEDVPPVEEAESIDASEQESTDMTEVKETLAEDDSVNIPVDEVESVGGDDDRASVSTETEVADVPVENTSFNDVEEVSEVAVEGNEETSAGDNVAESEGVVEVEVRQEGLDLSYPETETGEALNAESTEVSISALEEEAEPSFGGDEVLSASSEAEVIESEDVFVGALEEKFEPVMIAVDEGFATPSDADVEVTNLESDVDGEREVSEVDTENVEERSASLGVLQMEPSPELGSESESLTEDIESSIPTDIEVQVLELEGEEGAVSSLSEESELEAGEDELDTLTEAEAEEETPSDEEKMTPSDEDHVNVLVEAEAELFSNSSDVDAEVLLSEESPVSSSNEESVVIEDKSGDDHEESVAPAEVEKSSDKGENLVEEEADAADDELVGPDEVEAATELDLEENVAGVPSEDVVMHELTEEIEKKASRLEEGIEKVLSAPAEIEAAAEELSFPSATEVENLEEAVDEKDEVGNDDAESTTLSEVEVEQSASEVDLVSELGEETVVIEAAEGLDDVDTDSAEVAGEVNGHVEDAKTIGASVTEEVETLTADVAESAEYALIADDEANVVVADEEAPVGDDVVVADLGAARVIDDPMDASDGPEEASQADEPAVDETTEPQQAADELSAAIEEEASTGLASAVNEVLARLVEPFEAAKTAAPVVTTEPEHEVDEH